MEAMPDVAERPNDFLAVLRLVADRSIDEEERISVALNFTNQLKERWSPAPVSETNPIPLNPLSDVDKDNIKTLILPMMIKCTPAVQSQLLEAVSVIGDHDFPGKWPTLLPEIVANLNKFSRTNDYAAITLLLATVNSLLVKFRYGYKPDLLLDLSYCVPIFAKPLLEVFKRTATLIDPLVGSGFVKKGKKPVASVSVDSAILKPYIESQRLCCSIFYSLNFHELAEVFKEQTSVWMVKFKKYLTPKYLAHDEFGELQAAICDDISLYVEEDLFQDYLSGFVEDILNLLVSISSHGNGRDHLIVSAIKFFITVSKSRHHSLLSRDDILKQICVSVVIPNVMLQDEEKKLFEMDPVEYIKRDMEGSDIDTRRGTACELLKGIAINYKGEVSEKIRYLMDYCWNLYDSNAKGNWKYMDSANRLVAFLATKKADDGTFVSADDLVDIDFFFTEYVVREMDTWDAKSSPMMKAGVLKLLTVLRNQISKHLVLSVLPELSRFITSPDQVIRSYAAICIEKLLLVKDDDGARNRYTADDIRLYLPTLMSDLFRILSDPEFEENQYVMKCIMRVVCVGDLTADIASLWIRSIWYSLSNQLQNKRRVERVKNIVLFLSLFLVKDGPKNLVNSVNAGQSNDTQAVLEQLWIPSLELITCPVELKLASIASTRLICQSPDILDSKLWGKMLDCIVTLVSRCTDDEPIGTENATAFAQIYNDDAEDPLKEFKDPKQYLVVSLSNLFAASPQGRQYYHQAITESLDEANQSTLIQLFNSYNVCFV